MHKLDNAFYLDPNNFPTNMDYFKEIPSWFGNVDTNLHLIVPTVGSHLQDPTQKIPAYYGILGYHKTTQKPKP